MPSTARAVLRHIWFREEVLNFFSRYHLPLKRYFGIIFVCNLSSFCPIIWLCGILYLILPQILRHYPRNNPANIFPVLNAPATQLCTILKIFFSAQNMPKIDINRLSLSRFLAKNYYFWAVNLKLYDSRHWLICGPFAIISNYIYTFASINYCASGIET